MVVVRSRLITTAEYFAAPESNRHDELEFGLLVRDAASAGWHQGQVGWLFVKLFEHVRRRGLGEVRCAPSDVVLDEARALVLQPDLFVLLGERVALMRDKVWGAPDLVIEVASPGTRRRDRMRKVPWYRSYGVRECWLVDDAPEAITVYDLAAEPERPARRFQGDEILESRVLPDFRHPASALFDPNCRRDRSSSMHQNGDVMRARSFAQAKAQPDVQLAALTVSEYLELPETSEREELEFGWIVREPEANAFWHESEVIWLTHLLYEHVQQRGLGRVFGGRTGVVLDMQAGLIVSPDVMVLLGDRVRYIGDQIWGPPSLVIEIASPSTQKRDREKKVAWYRTYGVQECWLIDTRKREIQVFHFDETGTPDGLLFRGDEMIDSRVLPDLRRTAAGLLDPHLDDEPAPRPAGFRGAPDSEPPA